MHRLGCVWWRVALAVNWWLGPVVGMGESIIGPPIFRWFRGFVGDEILPNYIGIIVSHYKDPYKPTRI